MMGVAGGYSAAAVSPADPTLTDDALEPFTHGETIVTGKEEPERTRGFRETLREVVVKLTGRADLATVERLKPILGNPSAYIKEYTYEDRMKHLKVRDEQGTRDRPHYLRIIVDLPKLEAALKPLGLEVSRIPRRPVFVVLRVTDARGEYLVGEAGSKGYEMREVLRSAAGKRSLNLRLPNEGSPDNPQFSPGDGQDSQPRAREAAPMYVKAALKLREDGYWDFAAEYRDTAWPPSDREVACAFVAQSGVTFDLALGQLADKLLAAMTQPAVSIAQAGACEVPSKGLRN